MGEVAEDLKAIFKVRREKTARALAQEFAELHAKRFTKAVSVFEAGIERPNLPELPREPSGEDTHDEHAGAAVQGAKEKDEGGWGLPERDECSDASDGDSLEEQRGMGAEALPRHERLRNSGKTEPTTFETLTGILPSFLHLLEKRK